jgi:uncharacterized protein (TIGR02118 family)
MMYCLTVLYEHPADSRAFDKYYWETHVPLAKKMGGWTHWTIGKCAEGPNGECPPWYMIVRLSAETREALESILNSPEGLASTADVPHFATGGVTFLYHDEQLIM